MSTDSAQSLMSTDVLGYAELCRPGAIDYLERHRIPQLFRSLVAALMVEQPPDHVAFIKCTLTKAIKLGVANLNWETFVYPLHPKRSQQRLEFVRDGTAYERQGIELIKQQRLRREELARNGVGSPALPPLSPAPSLVSLTGRGDTSIGDLFQLTQGQWEDADGSIQSRQQQQQHPAVDGLFDDSQRLDDEAPPVTHEYVSSEVDKLLSEAIIMSISAREDSQLDGDEGSSEEALMARLQANLLADVGRSDISGNNDSEANQGFSLFD